MENRQYHELDKRIDVLEEHMKTRQAESESALERLCADMERWRTDMERLRTDMARRDYTMILAIIGIVAAGFTVFGFVTAEGEAFD